MREEKYANILEEDVDVKVRTNKKEKKIETLEEKDNKLSMTRELRFKEIQEFIDNGEKPIVEKKLDKAELDEKFQTFISENGSSVNLPLIFDDEVLEEEPKENVEELDESTKNDDIYLTSSFKPFKSRVRVSKFFKFLLTLVFVVTILCAFVYYICFPIYNKIIGSKPNMVFENTIKYVFDEIEHSYGENIIDSDVYYSDFKVLLNSNIEELKQYKNITFGYKYGVDNALNKSSNYIYLGNNANYYGINHLDNNGSKIYKYSTSQNYLKREVNNKKYFYNDFSKLINDMSVVSKDDFIYAIQKERDILISLLDEDLITASNDEIEIGDDTLKVIRNSFKLEGYELKQKIKKIRESIISDDRLVEIMCKYDSSLNSEFFQTKLKALEDSVSKEDKIVFNLYTINGDKLVGFDVEYNGFVNYYFYYNKDNLEAHFNFTANKKCVDDKECIGNDKKIIDLSGNKVDKQLILNVEYNGSKIAELSLSDFNFYKVNFDYKIFYKEKSIFGDVFFRLNPTEKSYNLNVTSNCGNENINFSVNLDRGTDFVFDSINEESILENNQMNVNKEFNDFSLIISEDELKESFDFWQKFMDNPQGTIEELKIFNN